MTHFVRSRGVECGFVESRFIELVTSAFLIEIRSFTHSTAASAQAFPLRIRYDALLQDNRRRRNKMFRSLFWLGLTITVSCLLFVAMLQSSMTPAHTAFAQATTTPAVIVERVWTRDGNGQNKNNFVRGDAIQYTVIVKNSGNTTVTAMFVFEATGPHKIFSWKQNASVAPGISGYYSPAAVPNDAPPGTYTLRVTVIYNGQSSSSTSPFTVKLTHPQRSGKVF